MCADNVFTQHCQAEKLQVAEDEKSPGRPHPTLPGERTATPKYNRSQQNKKTGSGDESGRESDALSWQRRESRHRVQRQPEKPAIAILSSPPCPGMTHEGDARLT